MLLPLLQVTIPQNFLLKSATKGIFRSVTSCKSLKEKITLSIIQLEVEIMSKVHHMGILYTNVDPNH